MEGGKDGDLYMIDGRFRVACFAQTILRCNKNAPLCFHDFTSHPKYHCIYSLAREVVSAEELSIFQPLTGVEDIDNNIGQEYRFTPDQRAS
jgi:hypothetical protein